MEDRTTLATKADLAELKSDLIKWGVGLTVATLVAMTGIFTAIISVLIR